MVKDDFDPDSSSPRTLLVVVAHPDDDSFGIAGTVALHAQEPGFRFVLIHATDGEAGAIAEGSGATPETLGAVRRGEDDRAWRTLGRVPDRHEWLGLPDGGVTATPFGDLVERIAKILAEERPDVVCTIGPDGITGHPDHITVGAATTEAFLRFAGDNGSGFRRLAYGVLRQSAVEDWNQRRIAHGLPPWDPTKLYHPRGIPDKDVDILVDTSSVATRVRAGLLEHRTQWADVNQPGLSEQDAIKMASRESMVIAWPPDRPHSPFRDVFEGL